MVKCPHFTSEMLTHLSQKQHEGWFSSILHAALISPQLDRETKRGRKMSSRISGDKREFTSQLVLVSLTSHGSTILSLSLLVCVQTRLIVGISGQS